MSKNHSFAMYMTNINNVNMFNNGTLHYNLTLPTKLDSNKNIEDKINFVKIHKEAIKIIQWFEPILLSIYGSPDPFSKFDDFEYKNFFSPVSQRCAVSRYIGIGTYNTDTMTPGKILTIPIESHPKFNDNEWWFNKYYKNCAYKKRKEIGLDINFNKHYSHGIEIRFFDYIEQPDKLFESFEFIIYLMDVILDNENDTKNILNPITNNLWNELTFGLMTLGNKYHINNQIINFFNEILNIDIVSTVLVSELYYQIYWKLKIKYSEIKIDNLYDCRNSHNEYKIKFVPKGNFSKLCLNEQQINIQNKYIDEYIENNIIKNKIDFDGNCIKCCVIN